jgi:hypothetical protein
MTHKVNPSDPAVDAVARKVIVSSRVHALTNLSQL